jgi:hypothetical protein
MSHEVALEYVRYIRSLGGDRAVVEFFYEALRDAWTTFGDAERTHWIIGLVTELPSQGSFQTSVAALPDATHYDDVQDLGEQLLCQEGECETCGAPCASWAKHMLCPVCGNAVYGT